MSLEDKKQAHSRFWRGDGPSLILIPAAQMDQYDVEGYRQRFENPELMWVAEMRRALPVIDWPTDGIPTVRPNLGVVFVPSIAGQGYTIQPGQMPWPGAPLSRDQIRASLEHDVASAQLARYASEFYALHKSRGGSEVAPYLPDTQGVFDIAHLLDGEEIFYEVIEDSAWIDELMSISLELYTRVSRYLKGICGESSTEMIHGHGTPQGVYFPQAGVRISEDSPTLLSSAMIQQFVIPYIERAAAQFGGAFVHYCGYHKAFFEQLCQSTLVRAIDLGNSEMYDLAWLLERYAATGTVLYSRVAAQPGEEWEPYVRRIAALTKATGARLILRPLVFPESSSECATMLQMWHDLTA